MQEINEPTINNVISIILIHTRFDMTELLKLATVNRAFKNAVSNPLVWRLIALENGFELHGLANNTITFTKNESIKYRVLNTLLLNRRFANLQHQRENLPKQAHNYEPCEATINTIGGMMLCGFTDFTGACVAGCVDSGKCCACCVTTPFFETLYPACFKTASTATCVSSKWCIIGHIAMYATPLVIGITAFVTCRIIDSCNTDKANEALPRLNEQIEHIRSVQHHGLFRKSQQPIVMRDDGTAFLDATPQRLAMMDNELIPLMKIRNS